MRQGALAGARCNKSPEILNDSKTQKLHFFRLKAAFSDYFVNLRRGPITVRTECLKFCIYSQLGSETENFVLVFFFLCMHDSCTT